ncbi:hypothetical protein MHU86_3084 [Fragilaria crotonensis]|nr:hypothetical protein MHU86_3084 [Fragilaria crotonensis]
MASAPSAWRNRDVLWQDLNRRFIDASAPKLGPHFAVDLSLSRLRRDKAAVINCNNAQGICKATTATASAVMDSRSAVSRAVLCAAASIAVEELTVAYKTDSKLDPLDIPQNTRPEKVNMGSVVIQAQTFGQRAIDQALNAARRSTQRLAYQQSLIPRSKFERVQNPFAYQATDTHNDPDELMDLEFAKYNPNPEALTPAWSEICLPRFTQVLQKGSGHAVYCDLQWGDRHGRIANLVQRMAVEQGTLVRT